MKLDILAEIDGKEKINVEFQNANEYNVVERSLSYGSGIMYDLLKNIGGLKNIEKVGKEN